MVQVECETRFQRFPKIFVFNQESEIAQTFGFSDFILLLDFLQMHCELLIYKVEGRSLLSWTSSSYISHFRKIPVLVELAQIAEYIDA